jgi:exonuclease SbcC
MHYFFFMIISSVKLHNIRSYVDETVSFPAGSVMLSGDIGSGKSTILLALEFALFGILRGSLDGAALLRNGKSSGFAELKLDVEGKEVIIKRTLKRNKDTVTQDSGYIIVDGKKTEGTPVELKTRILDLLGYPKELVTKSKSLIYRYTVYTPQEEMKQILLDERGYRLDTLRKVFQIDKYKRIRENAEVVVKYVKEQAKSYEGKIEDLDEKRKQKKQLETELKELKIRAKSLEPELHKQNLLIKEKQSALLSAEEKISLLNELKKKEEVVAATTKEKRKLAEQILFDISEADKKISELMLALEKKTGLKDLKAIKQWLAGNKIAAERDALKGQIAEMESELRIVNEKIAKHSYEKEASEKVKMQVAELEQCPTCLQPVTARHKEKIRAAENRKIMAALKLLEERAEEKSGVEKKVKELKAAYDSLVEKEKSVAEISADIRMVEEKSSYRQGLLRKQAGLKREIEGIEAEKAELAERIKNYAGIEESFRKTRLELEELQSKEKELLIKKAEINKEAEGTNKNLTLIEDEITKKAAAKERLEELRKKQRWLSDYFIELMEQMEKNVMQLVYFEFNEMFQNWFNILMEGALSSRLDDDFSPVIEQNGYEVAVNNLSGGERTACALAYRLALNKVINNLITGIKTRDLIILDEPTDGFSSEQLEKVRDVIEQLGVKQTIIVSHEPKIESFVDNIIKVTKNEHISSVS